MTITILIWVIVGLGGIGIIFGAIKLIPWFDIFHRMYGNNPEKAYIDIEFGEQIDSVPGTLYAVLEKWMLYQFNWAGSDMLLAVHVDYPWKWASKGRRILRAKPGKLWAQKLDGSHQDITVLEATHIPEIPGEINQKKGGAVEMNALFESGVTVEALHSIKGKGAPKWIYIVIVIAVLAGAYIAYNMFIKEKEIPATVPANNQGQIEIPPNMIDRGK